MSRNVAPELVTEADILEYDLDSNAVDANGRAVYNERFIHGEIYKKRRDVLAIVHNHSHAVIPFACTGVALQPIFHMSAFIGMGVPGWDIRDAKKGTDLLVRDAYLGEHLARTLGTHPAVLMRGTARRWWARTSSARWAAASTSTSTRACRCRPSRWPR
jgi:HCOMODA/2-hydroxy-3-carboxy-muconic semialdehyde decarboxylase